MVDPVPGLGYDPAATERFEEVDGSLQLSEPELYELVLGLEQGALGIEQHEQVISALAITDFREPQR